MYKIFLTIILLLGACGQDESEFPSPDNPVSDDAVVTQDPLALVSLSPLVGVDYDLLEVHIRKNGRRNIFQTLDFPVGTDQADFSLEPGLWGFQLDYSKAELIIYSSAYCTEEQQASENHTLVSGENNISVNVCAENGQAVSNVSIEPVLIE